MSIDFYHAIVYMIKKKHEGGFSSTGIQQQNSNIIWETTYHFQVLNQSSLGRRKF